MRVTETVLPEAAITDTVLPEAALPETVLPETALTKIKLLDIIKNEYILVKAQENAQRFILGMKFRELLMLNGDLTLSFSAQRRIIGMSTVIDDITESLCNLPDGELTSTHKIAILTLIHDHDLALTVSEIARKPSYHTCKALAAAILPPDKRFTYEILMSLPKRFLTQNLNDIFAIPSITPVTEPMPQTMASQSAAANPATQPCLVQSHSFEIETAKPKAGR